VSAGWVAGSVRARALARRRLGSESARHIAGAGSLREAIETLASTPYGRDIRPGQSLAVAQHMVGRTLLWHLRVLAGWLPRGGAAMLRMLAGWFEIANTDELLDELTGGTKGPAFQLGALATAWPRLEAAGSLADLRAVLASSAWLDPGGQEPRTIRLGMRASWAARVATLPHPAPCWAAGAAALLVAGERVVAERELPDFVCAQVSGLLGSAPLRAATLDDLVSCLPAQARWVLTPRVAASGLWQAEARWWARVERDGFALLASSGFASEPLVGAVAILAADAWRLRAALEMAARGGQPLQVYDTVAYNPAAYDPAYDPAAHDAPA
jgi:hypothetical protein